MSIYFPKQRPEDAFTSYEDAPALHAQRKEQPQISAAIFNVLLLEIHSDKQSDEMMPFIPFPGLWVKIPWRGMDYMQISDVYWDQEANRFEAFVGMDE